MGNNPSSQTLVIHLQHTEERIWGSLSIIAILIGFVIFAFGVFTDMLRVSVFALFAFILGLLLAFFSIVFRKGRQLLITRDENDLLLSFRSNIRQLAHCRFPLEQMDQAWGRSLAPPDEGIALFLSLAGQRVQLAHIPPESANLEVVKTWFALRFPELRWREPKGDEPAISIDHYLVENEMSD